MRDLQRVCTLCASKRRCASDKEKQSDVDWQSYCPNAITLPLWSLNAVPRKS
jgi:hypothetical protein